MGLYNCVLNEYAKIESLSEFRAGEQELELGPRDEMAGDRRRPSGC